MSVKDAEKRLMQFTLRVAGDVWTTIALPVVLLGTLGRWLDRGFDTKPYLLAAGLFIAFLLSIVSICHKAVGYGEQYRELTEVEDPAGQDPNAGVDGRGRTAYSSGVPSAQKRWPSWRDGEGERGPPDLTSYG